MALGPEFAGPASGDGCVGVLTPAAGRSRGLPAWVHSPAAPEAFPPPPVPPYTLLVEDVEYLRDSLGFISRKTQAA